MSDSRILLSRIERTVFTLRGQSVMLSAHLAQLYGVKPKVLVQAAKRNINRFPDDFMYQLTLEEWRNLKSQSVTSSSWGGARTPPYAFTELGVAMLSSVLNSERAIEVNIQIMRAFIRLREILTSNAGLKRKLAKMERKYDAQFKVVFDAIRQLMEAPPEPPRAKIGYQTEEEQRRGRR